jgi:hypothetical protein
MLPSRAFSGNNSVYSLSTPSGFLRMVRGSNRQAEQARQAQQACL